VTAGLDVNVTASLSASLGRLADEMAADRARRARLADSIWFVQAPAISFLGSAAPYAPPQWGPNTGYAWAVQRITVTPLGSSDLMTVYRGHSSADANGQNALNEWGGGTTPALATQPWHPGRTGLILMGDESLVFGGSLTSATTYFVNIDVIQLELTKLAYFLM
jgi:hypothetical protein